MTSNFLQILLNFENCRLRTRRGVYAVPLGARGALSPYTLYSNTALLVLNGTSWNIDNALLALNFETRNLRENVSDINLSLSLTLSTQAMMKNILEEHFREHTANALREPLLFGDYRTALDEGEPRLYEDIQDYDAAKALFQEVTNSEQF